ncbi:MAG: hypothetical protein BWY03_00500 [Parcubacteria group bacterium ADurb.Bin159]|nr:MAG: hypothetical protein BWY03_00500 [Parcubacteria group bacterium ADurb.Bin159]
MDWTTIILGFAGGAVRGLTGFIKHQFSYKNVGFDIPYFLTMTCLSGIIGLLVASVFQSSPIFSFVVGYTGGDFIENIYKIIAQKPSLYKLGDE